jgi:hypothetical protein
MLAAHRPYFAPFFRYPAVNRATLSYVFVT